VDWELVAVGVVIALQLATIKILFEMVQRISISIDVVGHSLQKIDSIIEQTGIGGGEPPNPVQQALAQLLVSRVNLPTATQTIVETIRSDDGKFSKEKL